MEAQIGRYNCQVRGKTNIMDVENCKVNLSDISANRIWSAGKIVTSRTRQRSKALLRSWQLVLDLSWLVAP